MHTICTFLCYHQYRKRTTFILFGISFVFTMHKILRTDIKYENSKQAIFGII